MPVRLDRWTQERESRGHCLWRDKVIDEQHLLWLCMWKNYP